MDKLVNSLGRKRICNFLILDLLDLEKSYFREPPSISINSLLVPIPLRGMEDKMGSPFTQGLLK